MSLLDPPSALFERAWDASGLAPPPDFIGFGMGEAACREPGFQVDGLFDAEAGEDPWQRDGFHGHLVALLRPWFETASAAFGAPAWVGLEPRDAHVGTPSPCDVQELGALVAALLALADEDVPGVFGAPPSAGRRRPELFISLKHERASVLDAAARLHRLVGAADLIRGWARRNSAWLQGAASARFTLVPDLSPSAHERLFRVQHLERLRAAARPEESAA